MIASLITVSGIPKPLLCHRKMVFVIEIPTILKPGTTNICITVAAIWGIYTCVWGCSPACALLEIILRGSTPIQHLNAVTWYPPACWYRTEKQTTFTLLFDKLFAICRDHNELHGLSNQKKPLVSSWDSWVKVSYLSWIPSSLQHSLFP